MKIEDITMEVFTRSTHDEMITVDMWNGYDVRLCCASDEIWFYTENRDVSPFIDEIKYKLKRFNEDRNIVLQRIMDEGYLQTAEAWAKDEDSEITLPISRKDFLESIGPFSIGFCIGDLQDEPEVVVYLGSHPDYFLGHVLCCSTMRNNAQIEYNISLEG